MKRIFLCTLVVCTIILTSLGSFSTEDDAGLVAEILKQTNQFRNSQGLPELVIREELNEIASKHSADMARGRVAFGHAGFEKRNERAKSAITGLHSFAENVAFGATSANDLVSMWKNSAGHRRNMLGNYQYIGIGVAKDRRGRVYYTEVFGG